MRLLEAIRTRRHTTSQEEGPKIPFRPSRLFEVSIRTERETLKCLSSYRACFGSRCSSDAVLRVDGPSVGGAEMVRGALSLPKPCGKRLGSERSVKELSIFRF